MTPVEFLTARYDELEGRIKAAAAGTSLVMSGRRGGKSATVEYVNALGLSHDYLLADIAAKRVILELHSGVRPHQCVATPKKVLFPRPTCETVLLLCQPFATHPDFQSFVGLVSGVTRTPTCRSCVHEPVRQFGDQCAKCIDSR